MEPLKIVKGATGIVVGMGVSKIVKDTVATNVVQETKFQKFIVFAGRTAIAMLVGEVVRRHIDTKIDEAAAAVEKFMSEID